MGKKIGGGGRRVVSARAVPGQTRLQKLNMDYKDRLLAISDEREDDGGGFFVDLKDGWSFGFGGNSGMFDTLKEVTAALKASRKG